MTAPRPLDTHDDIDWHEDGVWLRKYGCWPVIALIAVAWFAVCGLGSSIYRLTVWAMS